MKPESVQQLYGGRYAGDYQELWQHHEAWSAEAVNYVRSLSELIGEGTRWLDVGCGTGWFLSQFPGVERAGVDLSPDMLTRARANNPDALFLRQGDIRDDVPEWRDAWDLVSSTGQAWGYVDSIAEVERVAENMARWTSKSGVCCVQPPDLADLSGLQLPYNFTGVTPAVGTSVITGAIWNYYDEGGVHENQVWPSLDVWVRWLARWFRRVEVVTWPHDPPAPYLAGPRKWVIASLKRTDGDESPAEIVVHPAPTAHMTADEVGADSEGAAEMPPSPGEPEDLAGGDCPPSSPSYDHLAVIHDQVGALTADVAELARALSRPASAPAPGARLAGRRLYDQPLSYLVARLKFWEPRFWRAAARRVRRRLAS